MAPRRCSGPFTGRRFFDASRGSTARAVYPATSLDDVARIQSKWTKNIQKSWIRRDETGSSLNGRALTTLVIRQRFKVPLVHSLHAQALVVYTHIENISLLGISVPRNILKSAILLVHCACALVSLVALFCAWAIIVKTNNPLRTCVRLGYHSNFFSFQFHLQLLYADCRSCVLAQVCGVLLLSLSIALLVYFCMTLHGSDNRTMEGEHVHWYQR